MTATVLSRLPICRKSIISNLPCLSRATADCATTGYAGMQMLEPCQTTNLEAHVMSKPQTHIELELNS